MNALLRRLVFVLAMASVVLVYADVAAAKKNPCKAGPVDPSIDQYVEAVPSGCGRAHGGKIVAKLPKTITRALQQQGGSDAALLEQVATSSTFGAPAVNGKVNAKGHRAEKKRLRSVRQEKRSAVPEALGAIGALGGGSGGGRLLGLVIVMGATAAAAFAFALLRLRARGRS
jgi:hypothetical protein